MQQMRKIMSTLVDALEIGGGFTKPTLPIRSTSEMTFILASQYSVTFVFK